MEVAPRPPLEALTKNPGPHHGGPCTRAASSASSEQEGWLRAQRRRRQDSHCAVLGQEPGWRRQHVGGSETGRGQRSASGPIKERAQEMIQRQNRLSSAQGDPVGSSMRDPEGSQASLWVWAREGGRTAGEMGSLIGNGCMEVLEAHLEPYLEGG